MLLANQQQFNLDAFARKRYLLILAGCALLPGLAIDMYLPALPALARDLGANVSLANATMSVFLGSVAVGQVIFGPMSDRIGRRPLILFGLCAYFAGSLLATLTTSIYLMLAARSLQALGACAAAVVGRSVIRDLFQPQEAAKSFASMATIAAVVPVIAPSIGALCLNYVNWRGIFALLAIVGVMLWVISLRHLHESRSEATAEQARKEHPLRSYMTLLGRRRQFGYLLAGAFNSGAFFTYLAVSPVVMMQVYGLSPVQFSLLFSVNGIGLIAMSQLNRHLLKTRSHDWILQGSARNAILLALVLALIPGFGHWGMAGLLVPLFLAVSSSSVVQANSVAGALSEDPLRAGSASALFGSMAFGMGMVASLAAGYLYDGTPRALVFVMAACLVGTAISIRLLVLPSPAETGRHQDAP